VPLNKAVKQSNDNLLTPYINIASNITQLGTSVTPPNRGATSAYPTTAAIGDQFFDITTNELKVYTVNGWVSAGTAPVAPTNVVATSAAVAYGGTPGAVITWTPATTGVPTSSYVVTSNTGGFTATTTSNTVTIYGLTAGTSYTFTVTAKNSFGSNAATSNALLPITTPQTPTIGTPTITAAGLSVPVTANATGGSAITGYTVTSNPGNIAVTSASSPVLFNTVVPVNGGQINVGTTYSFTAVANNAAGSSLSTAASSKELDTPVPVTSGLICNYDFYRGSYGGQNWVPYSEDFTQSTYWNTTTYPVTVTGGFADPFGGTGAQLVVSGATNPALFYNNQVAGTGVTGTGQQTVSVYAKYYNSSYFTLNCYYNNDTECNVQFFLDGSMNISGDGLVSGSASITYVGNGWYYCQYNMPARVGTNTSFSWRVWPAGRGLTTTGCYFFGAQMKTPGSALGYLKTTSAYLNYNTGSTIYDLSGNGYNSTASANLTYSNTSTNGYGSLVFNTAGTTSVSLPNLGTGVANWSWSAWYNNNTNPGGSRMLVGGSAGYNYGDASWSSNYGEWYYPHVAPNNSNGWYNITMVSTSGTTTAIYRNGYYEGSQTFTPAVNSNLSGIILGTGFGGSGSSYAWVGSLGKFVIYNRALSASEVLQNYNADRGRYGV
jgi:hypothetical protein